MTRPVPITSVATRSPARAEKVHRASAFAVRRIARTSAGYTLIELEQQSCGAATLLACAHVVWRETLKQTRLPAKQSRWALGDPDLAQMGSCAGPRKPSCSSLETEAVSDGQFDQTVLSRDRGFEIIATLRRTDPDPGHSQHDRDGRRGVYLVQAGSRRPRRQFSRREQARVLPGVHGPVRRAGRTVCRSERAVGALAGLARRLRLPLVMDALR